MEVEMEETERPGLHPAVRLTEQQKAAGFERVCPHEHAELQIPRGETLSPEMDERRQELGGREWFAREHRVVDPRTGGMKNQKANRPDLVPVDFALAVGQEQESPATVYVRHYVGRFWSGERGHEALVHGAGACVRAMGGPIAAQKHLSDLYGAGALKYSNDNWRKGYAWSLSYSAALRHLDAIERGEMVDKESFEGMGIEVLHWACVWFHCATLWTFATKGLGTDDRPKPPAAAALKEAA